MGLLFSTILAFILSFNFSHAATDCGMSYWTEAPVMEGSHFTGTREITCKVVMKHKKFSTIVNVEPSDASIKYLVYKVFIHRGVARVTMSVKVERPVYAPTIAFFTIAKNRFSDKFEQEIDNILKDWR